jgi:hypothetical protein
MLVPKFTLNSNNGFTFCVPQHGVRFLFCGRQCTDREEHVIKAAVRCDVGAICVSKTEFTIRQQVPISSYPFRSELQASEIPSLFLIEPV